MRVIDFDAIVWHDYLVPDGNGMYHDEKIAYKSQIDDLPAAQPSVSDCWGCNCPKMERKTFSEMVHLHDEETHDKRTETHGVCLDTISRQAAIDALFDWEMTYDWDEHCREEDPKPAYIVSPSDVIEQLPSATCGNLETPEKPQHSEGGAADCNLDCISRKAAIDALRYAQHRFTVADEAGGMGTVKWSEDVIYFAAAERVLTELPSAQPDLDEWCTDCKEYDSERHCCPRWNRVIREAVEEAKKDDWIPCSKRLPEARRSVILSTKDGWTGEGCYWETTEHHVIWKGYRWNATYWDDEVTAWKPLPEPWKGEEE